MKHLFLALISFMSFSCSEMKNDPIVLADGIEYNFLNSKGIEIFMGSTSENDDEFIVAVNASNKPLCTLYVKKSGISRYARYDDSNGFRRVVMDANGDGYPEYESTRRKGIMENSYKIEINKIPNNPNAGVAH